MSTGESEAHKNLKRLAFEWAISSGLRFAGCEVRIPRSPYRADVAAMSRKPANHDASVALFECKQCRADFLRDCANEVETRTEAESLARRLHLLREAIATHRPDLRRGESLFAEHDSYDLTGLRHETFHRLEDELVTLQRKLITSVKFSRLHKYHAADFLYLVTEVGVVHPYEVPVGWGWLVREGDKLVTAQLPMRHGTISETRLQWLENIAAAGTSASSQKIGARSVNGSRFRLHQLAS
jgi:hypothetical protein